MGRPSKAVSDATRRIAGVPNYSATGIGTTFDLWASSLPELFGVSLVRDLFIMAETDETVGAMLFCITSTMQQISWDYIPQVDGVDAPEDPEAKKWAALAQGMLGDMDRPFADHVEDAMTMLWAGFAPVEMVFKRRDGVNSRYSDGYYGLSALNLIDQTTVWDWQYDDNAKLMSLRQVGVGVRGDGVLPLIKTLLYRTSATYNNPRGRPLFKNAWRVWRLKRKVQDSEAIGIERELVGLPIFEMPEDVINQQFETDETGALTEDAKRATMMVEAAKRATQDMRLNRSGGLVIPSDTYADEVQGGSAARKYNFRIQTSGGQRAIDSRTTARDYDHAMARVAMMQFLTLGQRSGGSYGLSEDQSSMAVSSITALAAKVAAEWNQKAVPLKWAVNVWPDKYRPRLKHSDINKNGIVQLGQFLSGLAKSADLWGGDVEARTGLLKAGSIPYDYEAQKTAAGSAQKTAELAANPPPPPVVAAPGAKPASGQAKPPAAKPVAKSDGEGDDE